MKLAVILDHHLPTKGGAERAVCKLIRAAEGAGHEVDVLCLTAADDAPGRVVRIDVPKRPRGKLEREFAERALDRAAAEGADVTLGIRHLPRADVYWPHGGLHAATLAAGERSRGGLSGSISALLHRVSPRHRAFLELEGDLLARGGAGRVWCVSTLVRDELTAAHPACAPRLEVHGNGVDATRFHSGLREAHRDAVRRRLDVPDDAPLLLFLGGNWRLKGLAVLRDTLARCTGSPWTVALMGRHAERAAAALRSGAGRAIEAGRVRAVPAGDVRPLYGAADLLLQPTFRDPCSLATLEALASGVPVLTTDANGARDALTPDCGASVPSGDAAALAASLASWIDRTTDPEERAKAGEAARSAAQRRDETAWLGGLLQSLATSLRGR